MGGVHLAPASTAPTGDRAAFGQVYSEQFDYVWQSLRRLGVGAGDVEDAVHDVFLVVQRRLVDYDPARPVRPWLFGIAYRIVSERRRRGSAVEVAADEHEVLAVADGQPSAEARFATEQARQRVHRALGELPIEQRAVVVMHDLEGHSASEVAEAIGIPLNTVYSRLRLGRSKFVAAVRALGETP
jgi:RNA polymerase sigma-70 factor (ECF subfamily)